MMGGRCARVLALLLLATTVVCDGVSNITAGESQENLRKLADANNNLALNLHRRLVAADPEQNVFFSPFSISVAFAMLFYGARGDTATELRDVLGYDTAELSDELVHATFKEFLTNILSRNSSNGYTVRTANAILVDKSLHMNPDFRSGVHDAYQARIRGANFAEDAANIRDTINQWVNKKTKGKIESLIERVPSNTLVLILNAVYFKGLWKVPFDAEYTSPDLFYNYGQESEAVEVDMMYMAARLPITRALDATILELPYKGDNISMLILLPNELDGLPELEDRLTLDSFAAIRRNLRSGHKIQITMPKFKLEFSKSMVEDLASLNMSSIFTPEANFTGIVDRGDFVISDVIHKAAIEVNEEGSTAAAVTAIYSSRSGHGDYFNADHPFLFAVVHKRNNLILFLGRVNEL